MENPMTEPLFKTMVFRFPHEPARVTHQSGLRHSKYGSYKTKALRAWEIQLEEFFRSAIQNIRADEGYIPIEGPIELDVEFSFKAGKKKDIDTWKITRPDLDNMIKTVKDVMTRMGFWKDDAQVCKETVSKEWTVDPGIWIRITPMGMKK